MVTYTDIYPDDIVLIKTLWFREEATQFNLFIPNTTELEKSITHAILTAQGAGGMGDADGGGGALVKSKVPVTPGELLFAQVGKCSTASVLGDSFIKRADNTVIVYADRGRGNGNPGLAINSTGQLKRDGFAANASPSANRGSPSSDLDSLQSLGMGGLGYINAQGVLAFQAADPGGAGRLVPRYDSGGNWLGDYVARGAGTGTLAIQLFNGDPGPLSF